MATEGWNGRRWLSNLARNFVSTEEVVLPGPARGAKKVSACVVAVPGPSLEESLESVRALRPRLSVWAVGSALDAVLASGIVPDGIVSTDSTVYATQYLRGAGSSIPVASPFTASRGVSDSRKCWPLSQLDPFELALFSSLETQPHGVPSHGTVTGTALHLALGISDWPVVLAGMDLAWKELRAHARPHLADHYRMACADRLHPELGTQFARWTLLADAGDGWRVDQSLRVYSEWFESRVDTGRVLRMNPSPQAPSVPVVTADELKTLPQRHALPTFQTAPWPEREQRADMVRSFLDGLARQIQSLVRSPGNGPDAAQTQLLRRLALEKLLAWKRTADTDDLISAARAAGETLESVYRG
jgi:hypothetical protein